MRPVAFELMLMTGKDLTSSQPSPSGIDPKFRNELPLARAAKAAEKTKPAQPPTPQPNPDREGGDTARTRCDSRSFSTPGLNDPPRQITKRTDIARAVRPFEKTNPKSIPRQAHFLGPSSVLKMMNAATASNRSEAKVIDSVRQETDRAW
jgi:hypothetical protein